MEPWWFLALFATGLAAGFVDAIAGGGGLLTVPVLLAAGLPPQTALGTNKFQSVCGTAIATRRYAQHGLLNWATVRESVLASFVGGLIGALTVTRIPSDFLRPILPFLLGIIVLYTWLKPELGRERRAARMAPKAFGLVFGFGLGFYDGFFGPGTGTFWTVACVLVCGLDLLQATAHTKAANLASNFASLLIFLSTRHVHFAIGVTMAAGQLLGAQLGARAAVRGGFKLIRPIFLTMVLALATKLAWDAMRGRH